MSTLVRTAKQNYFNNLITDNRDTATIWRAVNEFTRKSRPQSNSSVRNITPDSFNKHFLSLAQKLTSSEQLTDVRKEYECSSILKEFCQSKLRNASAFCIPPIAVHEVAKFITTLKSKKSMGPDNITPHLLKTALPYIVESLTYVYNLCIERNIFPTVTSWITLFYLTSSQFTLKTLHRSLFFIFVLQTGHNMFSLTTSHRQRD